MSLALFAGLCLLGSVSLMADDMMSQPYQIENIRHIEAHNAVTLDIRQSENESLSAEATAEVLERVTVKVRGERLILGVKSDESGFFSWLGGGNSDDVRFVIKLPQLVGLELSAASRARIGAFEADDLMLELSSASRAQTDELKFNKLELKLSGASRIDFGALKGETLSAWVSGASRAEVQGEGSVQNLRVDASGASRFKAASLSAENARVEASGASRAELGQTRSLEADASGASNISYLGEPRLVQKTSGASNIRSIGN